MWIHTRPRSEFELGILLNLDQASRININKLGEKWFVEAMIGTDAFPLAATASEEEAIDVVRTILRSLAAGETALDLSTAPAKDTSMDEMGASSEPGRDAAAA